MSGRRKNDNDNDDDDDDDNDHDNDDDDDGDDDNDDMHEKLFEGRVVVVVVVIVDIETNENNLLHQNFRAQDSSDSDWMLVVPQTRFLNRPRRPPFT